MTDHNHAQHGHGDYEREDFGPRSIFTFLAALGVFGLVVIFIIMGVFRGLDQYMVSHMKPASPLLESKMETYTRRMQEKDIMNFPAPRLDGGEKPTDVNNLHLHENSVLHIAQPEWSNPSAGEVRIPIDRAMDLIATRGLPARTPGAAPTGAPPKAAAPAAVKLPKAPAVGVMQ